MSLLLLDAVVLLALLACSAFFSSAETALFSLNPVQMHHMRNTHAAAAAQVRQLLSSPTRLLSTILVGNTLVNVAAAGVGFSIADLLAPGRGEIIAIPAMTFLLLVLGEVAPKRLAMARPEMLAVHYAPLLTGLVAVLAPLRGALEQVSVKVMQRHLRPMPRSLTEEEFRTVVEVGEEEGVLDREERTMVDGIIRLEETQASDVMTPRVDLVGIDLDDPPEERERIARSVTYRYLPVYSGSLDHVSGFLNVPQFLLSDSHDLGAATIGPFFVPETAPLDTLLAQFQKEDRRVAFVVDEFGGTAGMITRGDILEEIVSGVENEYGDPKLDIQPAGENRWLIDGSTSLEDVNYELNLDLQSEGADRMAGWVLAQAERIPRINDTVEAGGCRVTVQRIRHNRITQVVLEKTRTAPVPETESNGTEPRA